MSDSQKVRTDEHSEEENDDYDPEVEITENWKICDLPIVPFVTGEEDEDTVV